MFKSLNDIFEYIHHSFLHVNNKKNLVDNGGVLDRVHFISHVRTEEDARYLETIIQSNPTRYTFRDMGMMESFGDFTSYWDEEWDPNALYFKLGMGPSYISN